MCSGYTLGQLNAQRKRLLCAFVPSRPGLPCYVCIPAALSLVPFRHSPEFYYPMGV